MAADTLREFLKTNPNPKVKLLADVARFMRENFPEARDFPDREQPASIRAPKGRQRLARGVSPGISRKEPP